MPGQRILIVSGALRRHGSCEGTIDICLSHLRDSFAEITTEVVHLSDARLTVCDSCYTCDDARSCWIPDDVGSIVTKMIAADAIIYLFPVNAFGVNSLMQIFLERAGVGFLRFERPLENKVAGIVVTGRRYGHEVAWGQVALNVMLNKMILVGSGFPAAIKNDGKLLQKQIQDQEGVSSLKEMLTKMVGFMRERAYVAGGAAVTP